jgi:hypothetical protein
MSKTIKKPKQSDKKPVMARIDAADYQRLVAIAKANSRSIGAEIKHQLQQLLAA